MTDTNKGLAIVTNVRGAGIMRATEQPVTLGTAGAAEPQRTTDFQAVLLAMAGHDLRQPLQVIRSSHELLGTGVRTKSEQDVLRTGRHAIDRLGAARLHEHSNETKLSPVALEPLFRQACCENEERAFQKGIDIRVCATGAYVMSNAVLLSGILRNLVSNAIKYTEPKGRVLIGCRRSGQNVRIDVCDTGIGIMDEQLSRIFEALCSSCAGPSKCSDIASMLVPSRPKDHVFPYSQREPTRGVTSSRPGREQ
jgi:two-component system phosphate regulon sensor histidine kinase PhoR